MREETTCKPDYSNSMAEHLGIRFMPSATDEVRAEMPVDHRTSGLCLYVAKENMHAAYK